MTTPIVNKEYAECVNGMDCEEHGFHVRVQGKQYYAINYSETPEPIVNRPIKFRAWDGKKMFKVGVLNLDGEVAYEDYYWYEGDFSEAADYTETNNGRHSKGVLMQFTGILDSKGVEVYEGDLLVEEGETIADTIVWEVWFDTNNLACWMASNYATNSMLRGESFLPRNGTYDDGRLKCTVVGNIYQTPELVGRTDFSSPELLKE